MRLAIETSTRAGSVAVSQGGVIEEVTLSEELNHGAGLSDAIRGLVGDQFSTIEQYVVSIGPGSFTGLRVSLALLKGIGAVYPAPVLAISSLMALAKRCLSVCSTNRVLPLIDARKGEVFAGLYERSGEIVRVAEKSDGLYRIDDLVSDLGRVQDLAWVVPETLNVEVAGECLKAPLLSAATLLEIADSASEFGLKTTDLGSLEPAYHQLSGAERPR